ncbi:MAG: hypothetical protein HPY62_11635, partial [Bacteroidales bacterium]|nr:hypothetical protein [Bacteroidales bacterium]
MNSNNKPSEGIHFNVILRFYCNPAIFLLLITLSFPLNAQNYPFQEYTVFDGLPQTQARVLYQDRRGFIWIITRSGISRFDGVEFKNYYRKDGLPTNIISRIFEDNSGYLWALSDSGLSKYDGYSFRHFPYRERLLDEGFSSGCPIVDIILLVLRNPVSNQSRLVYFKDGKYFEYQTNNDILDTLKLEIVAFDEKSEYLIFLDKYMNMWKWRDKELTPVTDIKISSIRNDRGKILLESQDGDGSLFEFQDGRIVPYQLINNSGRTEITSVQTKQGEYLQLFRDGVLTNIRSFYHSSTLVDSESNIWIGSEVNMYRLVSTAIYSYSEEDGLPKNTWAIAEDSKGHIWFGSLSGDLIEFDGEKFIRRNDYKVFFRDSPAFFKGSTKTSDGKIYFSLNKGVLIWDGLKFSRLKGIPDETQICIIYEDPVDKSILFGTGSGLFQLKEGVMKFFPEVVPEKYGVIEGILRDDDGTYLLSGQKGLVRFDGRNAIPVKDPLVPGGYTFTLVKDSHGGIWITSEEGLLFLGKSSPGLKYGL